MFNELGRQDITRSVNIGRIELFKLSFYNVPMVPYTYTMDITANMFNYTHLLQELKIDDFKSKSPGCTCAIILKHEFKILMNSVDDNA